MECGNTEWMGQKIPLEQHHKDGNSENNSKDNLELLCANCHALTKNYGAKNKGNGRKNRYKMRG
jgi:predicted HNH restriction endonuclease